MTYDKNYHEQKQEYQQNSNTTSTTTDTRSQACTSEAFIKMQIEQIEPIYEQQFGGHGIPYAIGAFFARLIRAGMEPAVIASAIHATAWARLPTPYYMRAILQRYLAEGIMTEVQLQHDIEEQDEKRYQQRAKIEGFMYYD